MAEFEIVSRMDLAAMVNAAVKALKSYIPSDYKYAVVTSKDGVVKLVISDY